VKSFAAGLLLKNTYRNKSLQLNPGAHLSMNGARLMENETRRFRDFLHASYKIRYMVHVIYGIRSSEEKGLAV